MIEIEESQRALVAQFAEAATKQGEIELGYKGGTRRVHAFWCADHDLWATFQRGTNRFWNAFGTGDPFSTRWPIPITVEINPPLEGLERRVQGIFGRDREGHVYLLHRGGVGGGRKGVGKARFLVHQSAVSTQVELLEGPTRPSAAFVVAVLGEPSVVSTTSAFVHSVADFKSGIRAGGSETSEAVDLASLVYTPEFVGAKTIPAREAIVAHSRHGVVVERLRRALISAGHEVASDQLRDLMILSDRRVLALCEVKTGSDRQSIYGAIGQLMLHSATLTDLRIAVLPADVPEVMREGIRRCGIDVLPYRWQGTAPIFLDIERMLRKIDQRKNGA